MPNSNPSDQYRDWTRRTRFFGGFVLFIIGSILPGRAQQVKNCAFDAKYQQLARNLRTYGLQRQALEDSIRVYKARTSGGNLRTQARLIRIPIVVHVVHNTISGAIGGANNGNISDQQIQSQIQVLNEDYRRQRGTNGFNSNPVGADMEIEFFLATRDPSGNPSTGITRHYTDRRSYSVYTDDALLASIAYWPSDRYLNIWVTELQADELGYAQFPSVAGVDGLDTSTETLARTDGIFIDHPAFGRKTGTALSGIYSDGRTATHEIGHWLGLIHTWGDTFCGNDYCADTPPAEGPNRTVNCTPLFSDCTGSTTRNMIENYLDLSPDQCMNTFTQDQKARVRAVLDLAPRRRNLIYTTNPVPDAESLTTRVYPNPTRGTELEVEIRFTGLQDVQLVLVDLRGRILTERNYAGQPSSIVRFPVAELPTGLYLLRVRTADQTTTQRVMLLR